MPIRIVLTKVMPSEELDFFEVGLRTLEGKLRSKGTTFLSDRKGDKWRLILKDRFGPPTMPCYPLFCPLDQYRQVEVGETFTETEEDDEDDEDTLTIGK
jgi:hypothetical protein